MRGVAATRDNKDPPLAQAKGVAMLVNLIGLTDAEVATSLSQMVQAITRKS